jgi:nucleoside 2-deoxyribosyltransferase
MISVYIASPYTIGDKEFNVKRSLLVADALISRGYLPFVPLLSHYWNEYLEHEYDYWMQYDLCWLERCDAVLRLPGKSSGADVEVEYANRLGKPIYYSVKEFLGLEK